MTVYFYKNHPVFLFKIIDNVYYFKFRHLMKAFNIPKFSRRTIPDECLSNVYTLKLMYRDVEKLKSLTLHPTTLLINLRGLYHLSLCCCTDWEREEMYKFICECLSPICIDSSYELIEGKNSYNVKNSRRRSGEEMELDYGEKKLLYGVLKQNIEFIKTIQEKYYFKGLDVAKYINCTPSYVINKYVSNQDMVLWKDLKNYFKNNFKCVVENKWKEQTIFIKYEGLKHLLFRLNKRELFNDIISDLYNKNYDYVYFKCKRNNNKKRKLMMEKGIVFKYKSIDCVGIFDGTVWCKLNQFKREFDIKHIPHKHSIVTWSDIEYKLKFNNLKSNIKWKRNTLMINFSDVSKILIKLGKQKDESDFILSIKRALNEEFV